MAAPEQYRQVCSAAGEPLRGASFESERQVGVVHQQRMRPFTRLATSRLDSMPQRPAAERRDLFGQGLHMQRRNLHGVASALLSATSASRTNARTPASTAGCSTGRTPASRRRPHQGWRRRACAVAQEHAPLRVGSHASLRRQQTPAVEAIAARAAVTCELCGKPGEQQCTRAAFHWYKTLCAACAHASDYIAVGQR
jgi:hypothetical protein